MVFYRKYRPQTIDELDSSKVREALQSVLIHPPHAFLFTGPKGLGKTSTARIVAKVVNCTGRDKQQVTGDKKNALPILEPCNTCQQCESITNGSNMDVIEIDAASNRGIDEMRELKEKVRLAPLAAQKKVYIIDEVHMLTTEAFNALLKTLEEPPEHALFILCTTEPHKIPATILSRCFHIQFAPATNEELARSFQRIAKGEGLDIDKNALLTIAELSEGGFRDGAKILEEVAAYTTDKHITSALIEKIFHTESLREKNHSFLLHLTKREITEALLVVEALRREQVDLKYFLVQFLELLHQHLLQKVGIGTEKTDESLSLSEIRLLIDLFSRASLEMKLALLPQLPLELAIIEWGEKSGEIQIIQHTIPAPQSPKEKTEVSVTTLKKEIGTRQKIKALYGEEKEAPKTPLKTTDVNLLQFRAQGDITPEWLQAFWESLISEIKKHNHTIAGVLRGCTIQSFDRQSLIIATAYVFHKEKLDDSKNMQAIQAVCKELTGQPVQVSIVLTGK